MAKQIDEAYLIVMTYHFPEGPRLVKVYAGEDIEKLWREILDGEELGFDLHFTKVEVDATYQKPSDFTEIKVLKTVFEKKLNISRRVTDFIKQLC